MKARSGLNAETQSAQRRREKRPEIWNEKSTRHGRRAPETDKERITGCGSGVYGTKGQEGKTKGQKRDSSRTVRKNQYWGAWEATTKQRSNEATTQKNQGRKGLAAFAPSFNCAAKFLRLPGSIWSESKPAIASWQEVSERFPVESCACLCKTGELVSLRHAWVPMVGTREKPSPGPGEEEVKACTLKTKGSGTQNCLLVNLSATRQERDSSRAGRKIQYWGARGME